MSGIADEDRPQAADDAVGALWAEATGQANGAPAIAMLDPRQVVVPERLRPEDPAHTAALIESVRTHGVRMPIEVRLVAGRPVLIAGLHRVRAAIAADRRTVPALIREADDDQAELLEIEENLIRHDLNALDRAVFVARWKEVYQRLNPTEGKRGRKLRQVGAIAFSRSAEAKKIGLSKRSIEREARRVSLIAPDVRLLLAGTDAAQKGIMLDALGRLDHEAQRLVVARYRSGEAASIAAALRSLRGPAPAANEDVLFARLLAVWAKSPAAVQRRLLAHVGAAPAKGRKGA